MRTSKWLIQTHTDTGNDNTQRPKLASGKNEPVVAGRETFILIRESSYHVDMYICSGDCIITFTVNPLRPETKWPPFRRWHLQTYVLTEYFAYWIKFRENLLQRSNQTSIKSFQIISPFINFTDGITLTFFITKYDLYSEVPKSTKCLRNEQTMQTSLAFKRCRYCTLP